MKKIKYILIGLLGLALNQGVTAQLSYNYAGIAYDNVANNNANYTTSQNEGLRSTYLNLPNGIALDTNGRTYITHWNRLMLIDGSKLRGRAGGAGDPVFSGGHSDLNSIAGRMDDPRGVAVHPGTNEVYICDYGNHLIRKVSRYVNSSNAQDLSTFAGTYSGSNSGSTDGALASAKFNGPNDIVIMNNGDMYISDEDNNTIRKISGGMVSTVAGSASAMGDVDGIGGAARFTYPRGLCIEDQNNILIADYNNGKIKRLNLTTKNVTTVVSGLVGPQDVVSVNGKLYITERTKITKYENSTKSIFAGDGFAADTTAGTLSQTRFTDLRKILYNAKEDAFYVADYRYGIIKKIELFEKPIVKFTATPTSASVSQVVSIVDQTTNRKGTRKWVITPANYTLVNSTTLNSETVQVEFSQTGSYTVKLTYTYSGGSEELKKSGYINVSIINAPPVADFVADRVLQRANTDITLTDLSSNTPTSRLWTITPSAGVTFQSGTDNTSKFPVLQFANEGKYTVKLTATNANGSDDEIKTDYITIDNTASVQLTNINPLSIYPQPASNSVQINGVSNALSFTIYNLNGQRVLGGSVIENQVNVSRLNAGIYSIMVEDAQGNLYKSKLLLN